MKNSSINNWVWVSIFWVFESGFGLGSKQINLEFQKR